MDFQKFCPISETLNRYIDYYYFFKNPDPAFRRTYYSFPNLSTAINIHKNVNVDIQGASVKITGAEKPNFVFIASQVRNKPFRVEWNGRLDKMTIVFKPLGLNHFIGKPFAQAVPSPVHPFNAWEKMPGYTEFLPDFYGTADLSARISILESFLLKVCSPFPEREVLQKALTRLANLDVPVRVGEVAAHLGLSERTFNRLFAKHIGMTPAGYRKVARFRKSLENKLFGDRFKKLTELAYESNFYDQSYFIHIYNQLAGTHPKAFFDSVITVAGDRLVLQVVA
jgi:AraC-like DNA-binding protein